LVAEILVPESEDFEGAETLLRAHCICLVHTAGAERQESEHGAEAENAEAASYEKRTERRASCPDSKQPKSREAKSRQA